MDRKINQAISFFYHLLFLFLPLILFTKTSEIFEFNKIIFLYTLTTIIVSLWSIRSVLAKRIIISHSTLDIPLLLFLLSQSLSTIFSIDPRVSFLGYYGRFHQGLVSSACYSLLYWGFVSNVNKRSALKALKLLIFSFTLVVTYGLLQHLGVDKGIWDQEVQRRAFSTFGQPNWLAAWLAAVSPLIWASFLSLKPKVKNHQFLKFSLLLLNAGGYLVLIFTQSRSGFLGFIAANLTFWTLLWLLLVKSRTSKNLGSQFFKHLTGHLLLLTTLSLVFGTPWTLPLLPSDKKTGLQTPAPAFETSRLETSEIRLFVWQGAVGAWKEKPLLGHGVETFAQIFPRYKPISHNLTSEWNYIYNKAHNEYLNYLATAGLVGFLTYGVLNLAMIAVMLGKLGWTNRFLSTDKLTKNEPQLTRIIGFDKLDDRLLILALLSGYEAILITNLFGFSVVPIAFLFFIFPALAKAISNKDIPEATVSPRWSSKTKLSFFAITLTTLFLLIKISHYWQADYLFAQARLLNQKKQYQAASILLWQAINFVPGEPLYWSELAKATSWKAVAYHQQGQEKLASNWADLAVKESSLAVKLSPQNAVFKQKEASVLVRLTGINPDYLPQASKALKEATALAPTDPKLWYNLALTKVRTGNFQAGLTTLEKAIRLKPNYKDPRLAKAVLLVEMGNNQSAREELEFILKNIDANDPQVKAKLEKISSQPDSRL